MTRIHFVVSDAEKAGYQSQAQLEGKSLGAWMREAAREKLASARSPGRFSLEDLEAFNKECDAAEAGRREPDWPEQKRLIVESKTRGLTIT